MFQIQNKEEKNKQYLILNFDYLNLFMI